MSHNDIFAGLNPEQWARDREEDRRRHPEPAPTNPLEDPIVVQAVNEWLGEWAAKQATAAPMPVAVPMTGLVERPRLQ